MAGSSPPFRVLITGGTGFVGRHLIAGLIPYLDQYELVLGSHEPKSQPVNNKIRFVDLDVTNPKQVNCVIASERPTHIVHLAAISAVTLAGRDIRKTWNVNSGGTLNVAMAVMEQAPQCRLLHCSTAEIYGGSFRAGRALDETALLDPNNPYGASKAAADLMVGQMAKQGLRAIRVRPFNHTGPGQSEDFVVPAFAAQIARIGRGEQGSVIRVGDLSIRRDFLDVRDVVDAYVRIIRQFDELPPGCVFNIASGRAIAIAQVLELLLAHSNRKIEVVRDEARMRINDTPLVLGDAALARRLLGWAPGIEIDTTLASVLASFQDPLKNQRPAVS